MSDSHQPGQLNIITLDGIRERIVDAQERSTYASTRVEIVAVTKVFPVAAMESACAAGLTTIGESRVQEAESKLPNFTHRNSCSIHLIGHLQGNKARRALELFDLIESAHSLKLLRRLNTLAENLGKKMPVYLQVNAGRDEAKYGFLPEEIPELLPQLFDFDSLSVQGIMAMAPLTDQREILVNCFSCAREIRELVATGIPECQDLSMGMSADFELAVEAGATHIRLGSALFGPRPKP
jgi:pyridoxal phosphate enzyme (YggS family)